MNLINFTLAIITDLIIDIDYMTDEELLEL